MDLFSNITLPPFVSECLSNPRCKLSIVVAVIAFFALVIFGGSSTKAAAIAEETAANTDIITNVMDKCKYWWGAIALSQLFSSKDGSEIQVSKPIDDIFAPDAILSEIQTDLAPF